MVLAIVLGVLIAAFVLGLVSSSFLRRFYSRYWRWSYPLTLIFLVAFFWAYRTITSVTVTDGQTAEGPGWFIFCLVLAVVGIAIYYQRKNRMPPGWLAVTAVSTPLLLWGFWLLAPEWYVEWRNSKYFLWMILVTIVSGWLASNQTALLANTARVALLLMMFVAVGIGAYERINWHDYVPSWMGGTGGRIRNTVAQHPVGDVLSIIADCESGDNGVPGSGRQFKNGKLVVNDKNKDGTVDRGKWQINSRHNTEADRHNLNLAKEEDNRKFAEILIARNPDLRDWKASRRCWEPRLLALAAAKSATAAVGVTSSVPVTLITNMPSSIVISREWSSRIMKPDGYRMWTRRTKTVAYESRDQTGEPPRQYPRIRTPLPPRKVESQWLELRIMEDDEESSLEVELIYEKY